MNGTEIVGLLLATGWSVILIVELKRRQVRWRRHVVRVVAVALVIGMISVVWLSRSRRAFHGRVREGDIVGVQGMLHADPGLVNTYGWFNHTPLLLAVQGNDVRMAELLISRGADVDADAMSETPLAAAAAVGRRDITQVLLRAGANRNMRAYRDGKAPIHLAAEFGHVEIVKMLIAAGADVNARSEMSKRSPLDDAATQSIRSILVKHGAR